MGAPTGMLLVLFGSLLAGQAEASQDSVSPLQKVLQLLTDLHGKVVKEGEAAHKTYVEFGEWCEDRSKNLKYEVTTAKSEMEELKAAIEQAAATSNALDTQIEETIGSLATSEADLKAATKIRKAEEADFAASGKELVEIVSVLERAIAVLEREARKGGAAMMQIQNAGTLLQAVQAMVDASMVGSQDASTLTALVQNSQKDKDESDSFGAPEATVYASHSGSIIDTLEDLLDKAKDQLDAARTKETSAKHNFEMLAQSLTDEIRFGNEDLAKAKKNLALQKEAKASAEGDLGMTQKSLAEDEKTMGTLKQDCMMKAQDYEAETKSRGEEIKALLEAKKVLSDMAGGAADVTYSFGQTSFVQLKSSSRSTTWTSVDLANFEAVRLVRNLAKKEHSDALALLARRMASAMRYSTAQGDDPFAKVKGLIKDMIETLLKDADADATHKAYCDKELGETATKKAEKGAEIDKLSTKIDSMTANSAKLKEEVADLQKALADLASSQAELTKLRQSEKAEFEANKPEMESGLEGVKMALKVLREYYNKEGKAHSAAGGAGGGIIGLLEVVESDFAQNLAEMSAAEATSQADYERETKENEIEKATKESSVKYKTKEYKQLDASVAEASSDREGVQTELTAILDYNKHLLQICTAKAETYEERKARREAEIAGLKEALKILDSQAVLLQRRSTGRRLGRGLRGGATLAADA
uniref:Uncharacterized protein n=1 Tax=Alexandrium andersonii TaxID=327968 RepID=A0A7S2GK40_9DINO|mmetsp:Transcript_55896/g.125971  ORF Transcript_55896/g.125971 Transcript_55896/m.125971 type:complete len:704 (+) Transcript_55896:58-2169(+)